TNGGFGTVFRITTNGAFASLFSFAQTNGSDPTARMAVGTDGALYGTTYFGGTNGGLGTIFKLTTNAALTTLVSFGPSPTNGRGPFGGLTLGKDGNFYGANTGGGDTNLASGLGNGTAFRMSPDVTFGLLRSF